MKVPEAYRKVIDDLEELMIQARQLGLYRTGERIHRAIQEARDETFEAMPRDEVVVKWKFGPVSEQNPTVPGRPK